jgi:hypothetical protein
MAALQKTSMDTRNIPRKTEETEETGAQLFSEPPPTFAPLLLHFCLTFAE